MPELEQKTFQKRLIAYKIRISDIIDESFTKDELSAGYIKLNKVYISRVNVIATIVYKAEDLNYANAVIDDGTGRISLRSFENNETFSKIDVGEVVLVIGKIREFNNEKYIAPEILKKIIDFGWVNVRKMELKNPVVNDAPKNEGKVIEEITTVDLNEKIYLLIKELDNGDGADVDEIIKSANDSGAENIVNKLLESGDIFEIKPGKLKILE